MNDGLPCLLCGRDVSEHLLFFGEPPEDHGLILAEFRVTISGLYCPPIADEVNLVQR